MLASLQERRVAINKSLSPGGETDNIPKECSSMIQVHHNKKVCMFHNQGANVRERCKRET